MAYDPEVAAKALVQEAIAGNMNKGAVEARKRSLVEELHAKVGNKS
jgi:hypothetical protein